MDKIKNIWHHSRKNIFGLFLFLAVFCSGFFISGNIGLYLNLSGFIIVIGGITTSLLIGYRTEKILILIKVLFASYSQPTLSPPKIVKILVDLSVKNKFNGILSLQKEEKETTIFFLRQAIGLMVDDYRPDRIKEFLNAEMFFFKKRREETIMLLQSMADIAPSFGLVGSVVGLIGMVAGVGDSATLVSTIPIALTSTLYGIILANMFFYPFAANIRERTSQELLLQFIITEGIVAIAGNIHPKLLDKKLKSYLTPSAREEETISLAQIKEMIEKDSHP